MSILQIKNFICFSYEKMMEDQQFLSQKLMIP